MTRLLLKLLGGVPRADYLALQAEYLRLNTEIILTIEKHQMQGAWQQMKEERKQMRMN